MVITLERRPFDAGAPAGGAVGTTGAEESTPAVWLNNNNNHHIKHLLN